MARFSGLTRGLSSEGSSKVGTAQLPASVLFGSQPVFNVLHPSYGAKGDGVTDDAAKVQAAHDALKAAGGGILFFPMTSTGGTYLLNGTPQAAGGVSWAVALSADNIRVVAAPGVTYKTTINAATFFFGGCLKPGGPTVWYNNRVSGSGLAVKTLKFPALAGANTVTTATAGDAGTFATGDWIYIKSGECVTGTGAQSDPTEPDAEINQVLSANAGTGVITLRWPISKTYTQEYFPSGGSFGPTIGVTQLAASTLTTGGTGLTAATTYFYKVTAFGAGGFTETPPSNEQSILTGAGTTNSNTVTWVPVQGATSYRVYRGTASGSENVFYAVPANSTSFIDTGAASTGGTPPAGSFPAPFGVSKITDRMQQNISFEGGKFLHTGDGSTGVSPDTTAFRGMGAIFGLRIRLDPGSVCSGNLTEIIEARNVEFNSPQVHFSSLAPSYTAHVVANADTGSTDIRMEHPVGSAEKGVAIIEIHEGASIVKVDGAVLMNPVGDTSAWPSIHVSGRAYDVTIDRPTVINGTSGQAAAIYVDQFDPGGGGKILDPRLIGTFPNGGIALASPDWRIIDPIVPDGVSVSLNATSAFNTGPRTPVRAEELTAFIDFSKPDARLGMLPRECYVKAIRIQTLTAFNAGTTNQISIGVPTSKTVFLGPIDVTATGVKNTAAAFVGYLSGFFYDVHAYYTQTGAAATTGRALVTIEYAPSLTQ